MPLKTDSPEEYYAWKREVRNRLGTVLGLDKMERCEAAPRLVETTRGEGYLREKVLIQTEPDVWMPFYVLIPEGLQPGQKCRCVIAPHGHESGGKLSIAGRGDIPAIARQIQVYGYTYGLDLVKRGYMVFCPDARGFGERREWTLQKDDTFSFLNSTCAELNHVAISLGMTLAGMWVWDLQRLIDYIQTREDCDGTKLACAGLSGGGYQSLLLAAMDDRVNCVVTSGYFYGVRDSLLKLSNNCACNYVPGLWNLVDMGDIGALVAPRALMVETGTNDPLNGERGVGNVAEQVEITAKAYEILGVPEKLSWHTFSGAHRWDGATAYDFIDRYIG